MRIQLFVIKSLKFITEKELFRSRGENGERRWNKKSFLLYVIFLQYQFIKTENVPNNKEKQQYITTFHNSSEKEMGVEKCGKR